METTMYYLGFRVEGQGDLVIMEKKMETTIYYLGFRVEGQGDLVVAYK